jgi:initiation factor 1A
MVKNQTGGNRAKSFARKNESAVGRVERLRLAECDEEVYACVTKLYGNTCAVTTIDGLTLMGHIRKKFSGRGKRTSTITNGCAVLVGLRHWEKEAKNCDILEVYNSNEVEQLKNIPKIRFERLLPLVMAGAGAPTESVSSGGAKSKKILEDAFDFGIGGGYQEDLEEIKEELSTGANTFVLDQQDIIDIDDI